MNVPGSFVVFVCFVLKFLDLSWVPLDRFLLFNGLFKIFLDRFWNCHSFLINPRNQKIKFLIKQGGDDENDKKDVCDDGDPLVSFGGL